MEIVNINFQMMISNANIFYSHSNNEVKFLKILPLIFLSTVWNYQIFIIRNHMDPEDAYRNII